jgi:hypothetical protein
MPQGHFNYPHFDAAENLFFERELLAVAARSYDVKYPQLKGRQLVPVNNKVNPGATSYKFSQYDMAGVAKVLASYADDLPEANVKGKEFFVQIKPVASSFRYNIDEIRNAAFAGQPLEQRLANACRLAIEKRIDAIIASGDTDTGLVGLFGLSNTWVYTVPNGTSGHTAWSTKTPLEILADLNAMATTIVSGTNEVEVPDTLILPIKQRQQIATTPMFSVGGSNVTIEKFFLENNPYVKRIVQWYKATGTGVSGADRAVCYRLDPEALEAIVPLEAEFLPPQPQNLTFKIPAHAKCAGVVTYYPMSICYADAI